MKLIFIMADSLRRDHLGAYGNRWIHTPYLDRLAQRSYVFDRCFIGSFPTGPNRRDIHLGTGDKDQAFNRWRDFDPDEVTLAQRVNATGTPTMMITDVANGLGYGRNMCKGFQAYTWNRGQEGDRMDSDASVPLEWPVPHHLLRYDTHTWQQILTNRAHRTVEDDYFAPGTYKLACEWLERNWQRQSFHLWIETFDPHEPWDPPRWYIDMYDPGYRGRVFEAPPYGFIKDMGITRRELRHIQARYAAEVTMVDNCVGRLLQTLEKLGLLDEVGIVFTSDHGIYVGYEGDAGLVCKPWVIDDAKGYWLSAGQFACPGGERWLPLRAGLLRIPLLIHLPGQTGSKRIRALVQPWDLHPTMLELHGAKVPGGLTGRSLVPLLTGDKRRLHQYVFNGTQQGGKRVVQTSDGRWLYSYWTHDQRPPSLLDLKNDPAQGRNLAGKQPDVCRQLHRALEQFDPSICRPEEQAGA